jgi:hypothetical protein
MSPCDESTPSACKRFDRKEVLPLIETRYKEIAKNMESFPLDIIADLVSNSVGSEKAQAAVRRAIEYSKLTNTRFIMGVGDQEIVLDTFKPVEFHVAANKGLIHPSGWNRSPMIRAALSECVEYFTESKKSTTTGLRELYVAVRIGESKEDIIGVLRGSKVANPF